ncbi:MAG: hypothetical protein A2X86_12880 [Bdellovibrionales bacterium GWA2_49_15]|nr:MAG: hypothetical protein A2X86_12880 [Bdellovibrionales bacterium GWA2_49_15]HAZ13879.1 hypothetical protein [Bdellovibrionales bacterium]
MSSSSSVAHDDLARLIAYFFREYLPTHKGVSPNTIRSYRDTFKLFLSWLRDSKDSKKPLVLSDIRPKEILEFLRHLETDRLNSISTRNARLAGIKTFFLMCYLHRPELKPELEAIQFIPKKKMNTPLIDFFEHEDVMKMLSVVDRSTASGAKDFLILNLLYDTGMRASEVCGLRLDGFNSAARTIEILGKGNKWRKIHVWPRTVELINNYIHEWRKSPRPIFRDLLIINHCGKTLTRFGVHKLCAKYLKKADIPKQIRSAKRSSVHSWRHTAAVNMIRQGYSLLEVKVRLGHARLESTMKYLNLDLSIKKERVTELLRFTEHLLPSTLPAQSVAWKTTDEVIAFLKSV